jgi:hypothetical protein
VGVGGGVLLGLLAGSLLMRQRLLRRERTFRVAVPTKRDEPPHPVNSLAGGAMEAGAAPEMSFAARLYPGEITITLDPLTDSDQVAFETNQHA